MLKVQWQPISILDGNGIDVNPGSDTDANLITVGVTGTPRFDWDESEDCFYLNKGLMIASAAKLFFGALDFMRESGSVLYVYNDFNMNNKFITQFRQVLEAHTSADTLTLAESGSVHTNLGAGGAVALTLPASGTSGTFFDFAVMVAQSLQIVVGAAGEKIYHNGTISTDDGGADLYVAATDEGDTVRVVSDGAGGWVTMFANPIGDWTVTQP